MYSVFGFRFEDLIVIKLGDYLKCGGVPRIVQWFQPP